MNILIMEIDMDITLKSGGDAVLNELWRIKDALAASSGHDVHRFFAEARERQKRSGHPVRLEPTRSQASGSSDAF